MEMEKKLDWTMLRKKVEVQDAMGKVTYVRLVHVQPCQTMLTLRHRQRERYEYSSAIHPPIKVGNARDSQATRQTSTLALVFRHGRSRLKAACWRYELAKTTQGRWRFLMSASTPQPPGRSREKIPPKKFSNMVKSIVVDFDRDPSLHPAETNIVEACFAYCHTSDCLD